MDGVADLVCFGAGEVGAGGEPLEPLADTLSELLRGFSSKGESEDLVGTHVAVGDKPHYSSRHRLGFSCSCAGDDEEGARRSGDDVSLLVGGGEFLAEEAGDISGCVAHPRPF